MTPFPGTYFQRMSDDQDGERISSDRTQAGGENVRIGKHLRQTIAHALMSQGYYRPGTTPQPELLCPDEDNENAAGLT